MAFKWIKPYVPSTIWQLARESKNVGALITSRNYRFVRTYPPGHFYSPIPDIADTPKRASQTADLLAVHIPGIDLNVEAQIRIAKLSLRPTAKCRFIKRQCTANVTISTTRGTRMATVLSFIQ